MKTHEMINSRKVFPSKNWGIKSYHFILSLFLLLSFISCNKEDIIPKIDNEKDKNITIHDGRFVFKDSITYVNHLNWIFENQKNPKLIIEKNCSLGLKSMSEIYEEGMKMAEDDPKFIEYIKNYPNTFFQIPYDNSIMYELPNSKVACFAANKDGIFQIGNKIYRVAFNYIYEISDGDESKIDMLLLSKDQIKDESISIRSSVSEKKGHNYGSEVKYFSDSKYRIIGNLWEYQDPYNIWRDDAETIAQKKTLGVWFRANLNTLTSNDSGYMSICSTCEVMYIDPGSMEDNYSTRYSFAMSYYQLDFDYSFCPVTHRGRYNNQYIYIYWDDAFYHYVK